MKIKDLKCQKCGSQDLKGQAKSQHHMILCRECGAWVKNATKEEKRLLEFEPNNGVMQVEDGKWNGTKRKHDFNDEHFTKDPKHLDVLARLDIIGKALFDIRKTLKQMQDKEE